MRRGLFVWLALACFGLTVGAGAQQDDSSDAGPRVAALTGRVDPDQAPTGEVFESYILVEARGGGFRDPRRVARIAEQLSLLPFRNVLLQVRVNGEAYYNSALVPKALGVSKDFDPLAEFLKILKQGKNPKRVYAWLDLYGVGNVNRAVPLPPEHVTISHPEWLNRNSNFEAVDPDGNVYLDPAQREVRAYISRVVAEVVGNYAIDGVIVDGIRYPGFAADWGYNAAMLDAWRKSVGSRDRPAPRDEAFSKIRRNTLDQTMRALKARVKEVREDAMFGAFAATNGPPPSSLRQFLAASVVYHGAMQNWPRWVQRNWVDQVFLRNYRTEGTGTSTFDGWNIFAARLVREYETEIVPVISGVDNISVDVVSQIRRVQQAGLVGVGLNNFNYPIRDLSSRELFFKALSRRVLAPGSERLSFPKVEREVASVLGDKPDLPPPPEAKVESAPSQPERATEPDESEPPPRFDNLRPARNRYISPSDRAVSALKRKFPNIF